MTAQLSTIVLCSVLMATYVIAAEARPAEADSAEPISFSSGVTVFSPVNTTYGSRYLTLNLTFGFGLGVKTSLNFSIDDKQEEPIPFTYSTPNEMHIINKATAAVPLPELVDGQHKLTIKVHSGIYDYHGANPPGVPFKPSAPGSSDYTATWTHAVYFTVNSPQSYSASDPTPSPTPTAIPTPITWMSQPSPTNVPVTVNKHFEINSTIYAFQGFKLLCSFNATAGTRVVLDLALAGDNSYETTLEVTGSNIGVVSNHSIHGGIGVSNITQTVLLESSDTYNITALKHPFYSTVNIKGTIDVHGAESADPANSVTPSAVPSPTIPEFRETEYLAVLLAALAVVAIMQRASKLSR